MNAAYSCLGRVSVLQRSMCPTAQKQRPNIGEAFHALGDVLTRNLTWHLRVAEAQERERIEQELRVARQIQRSLLPEATPELYGWQLTAYYEPAREVGGDFYDFLELQDGRLGLVVGDATARSPEFGLAGRGTGAGQRRIVSGCIPSAMFVTCFYAILDPLAGRLRYSNAGHDLSYVLRNGEGAHELRATGMPLGLMPEMGYEEKEAVLREGDSFLFYSDGLVEAHDPDCEMFGIPRLGALVAEHGKERSLVDALLEELYSFTGEDWEQEDDITLLTLLCSAARGRTSENA